MSQKKKIHKGKIAGGVFYLLLGVAFLSAYFKLQWFLRLNRLLSDPAIQWCIGWSSIGVGAGLINTRTDKAPSCFPLHYFGYYGFVLFVVCLAAYTGALYGSNESGPTFPSIKFFALSALISVVGGFLGHKLYEISTASFKRD
jgi:hypothetical protein